MSAGAEKEFTVFLRDTEFIVKAERFVLDDNVLTFLSGTTRVAMFSSWDAVI